jgi:hypothetical protein
MSPHNTADIAHLMRNVQKNWDLSDPVSAFRRHLRPQPTDKPQDWTLRTWQALDHVSALMPEYRGHVVFQERLEKLWRDEKRVRVNGITSEDLNNVLVYFQGFVQGSEQHMDNEGMTGCRGGVRINEGDVDLGKVITDGTVDSKFLDTTCADESKITETTNRPRLPQPMLSKRLSNHVCERN